MAPANQESIFESVQSLPPLPAAVTRLLALLREPDADFGKIASVLETDQTLTARTLRAANSPIYGVSRRVQTVRTATVMLGRTAIMGLVVAASMERIQNSLQKLWPFDAKLFWQHNLAVALIARALAKHYRLQDPEEAYVAGLLHDIGKLVMLNHFGENYAQLLRGAQHGTKPLYLLERAAFETDHAASGQALCLHWHIPHSLTHAVAKHHDEDDRKPESVTSIVRRANELAKMTRIGESGDRFIKLRSFGDLPEAWLRRMLMDLPGTVQSAERLFTAELPERPAQADAPPRPLVHLQVTTPEEEELLTITLLALGYEPVPLFEDLEAPQAGPDAAPLVGIVTDVSLPPVRQIAYRESGAAVLDYTAWREKKGMPTDDGHFNVSQLQTWLAESLPEGA